MQASLPTPPGFDRLYGLELLAAGADEVRGRVAVREEICQPFGIVHGGIYAAVAESLASLGTAAAVLGDGMSAMGMSNSTTFLRSIAAGSIHALARPRHRGRTTWVWDVELSDDGGQVCAVSRVTIAVRAARQPR